MGFPCRDTEKSQAMLAYWLKTPAGEKGPAGVFVCGFCSKMLLLRA